MPATGAAARPPLLVDEESVFDWMQVHVRELLIALLLVVLAVGGVILYRNASATQAAQAENALVGPEQSIQAGNLPLAQSDLRRVMTRYANTAAAAQAAMLLADTYYQQQKYAEGVAALQQASTSGAAKPFAAGIERLIAEGYVSQGKPKEAATHFVAAAGKTPYPTEQARLRASAARAYAAAGDTAGAVGIWRSLLDQSKNGEAAEAQLMLGELTVKAAKP
jgi:predicted negative regulator of RcsB-dependent stress response